MKAILEFNLPEDEWTHEAAVSAVDMRLTLCDLDMYCRTLVKHGDLTPEQEEVAQKIRDHLHELISERSIPLD